MHNTGNAQGNGIDFDSRKIIAVFTPGVSRVNVSMTVVDDHIFEPTESLAFRIVIPKITSDNILIKQGVNSIAKGIIINSGEVVRLSADNR